jgi:hypothetical protein
MRARTLLVTALPVMVHSLSAQSLGPASVDRLRTLLPAQAADRVLRETAGAESRRLPAEVLLQRAIELAVKGVAPASIEDDLARRSETMQRAREALVRGGRSDPAADEIDAGATALAKGVAGAEVSALARSVPSSRSLAVPLFVIASLVDRGLPADAALARVEARLQRRATDRELDAAAGRPEPPGPPGVARLGRNFARGKDPVGGGRGIGAPLRPGKGAHVKPEHPEFPGRPK